MYSYMTWVKWKLILVNLETVLILTQDRCTVWAERVLVFLTIYRKNPQAYGITIVGSLRSIQGIAFSQGTKVFLLANLSKDNTRIANEGREGFLWLKI